MSTDKANKITEPENTVVDVATEVDKIVSGGGTNKDKAKKLYNLGKNYYDISELLYEGTSDDDIAKVRRLVEPAEE